MIIGWLVKSIELDLPTLGKHYKFTVDTWLARDQGDGKTDRKFEVGSSQATVSTYKPCIL